MVFCVPLTRTRGAFEAGMELLGGHALHTDVKTARIWAGEGKNWNTDGTHQLGIGYYIRGKVEEII